MHPRRVERWKRSVAERKKKKWYLCPVMIVTVIAGIIRVIIVFFPVVFLVLFIREWRQTPSQDAEGYYLLGTRDHFEWFVRHTRDKDNRQDCARMTADIILNDTTGWEEWGTNPPKYRYDSIAPFSGVFDGNGYTIRGYYSADELPVFSSLDEGGVIRNLTLAESYFQTTLENASYVEEEAIGEAEDGTPYTREVYKVYTCVALCGGNYGVIENCEVEAVVRGGVESWGNYKHKSWKDTGLQIFGKHLRRGRIQGRGRGAQWDGTLVYWRSLRLE